MASPAISSKSSDIIPGRPSLLSKKPFHLRPVVSAQFRLVCLIAALPFVMLGGLWSLSALPAVILAIPCRYSAPSILCRSYKPASFINLLLFWLPISLLTLTTWQDAIPKYVTLLYGVTLMYTLADLRVDIAAWRLLVASYLIATCVVVGGAGLASGLVKWKLPVMGETAQKWPVLLAGITQEPGGRIHPNEVAGALTLILPLGIGLLWAQLQRSRTRRTNVQSVVLLGLLAVPTVVFVLASSRSAYLGVVAGIVALVYLITGVPRYSERLRRMIRGVTATLLATCTSIVAWLALTNPGQLGPDSLGTRLELWHRALLMLLDFPLSGIGLGQFSAMLKHLYPTVANAPDSFVPHAHNLFLQWALDLGIPLASILVAIVLVTIHNLRLLIRSTYYYDDIGIASGLVASLVAFVVFGLTDAMALGARGLQFFWIVMGLSTLYLNIPEELRLPPEASRRFTTTPDYRS